MKYDQIEEEVMVNYISGLTPGDIAIKHKVPRKVIYYILKKNNIKVRKEVVTEQSLMKLYLLHENYGHSIRELSSKYFISKTKLHKLFNSINPSDNQKELVYLLFKQKKNNNIIARELCLTNKCIRKILKEKRDERHKNLLENYNLSVKEVRERSK
jgi:AraC-like DNA-binding protein